MRPARTLPESLKSDRAALLDRIDPYRLPRHVALIMDGNGRWARRRGWPRIAGYQAGVRAVRSTVETAARIGIPSLTLYALSAENWQRRPATEIEFLMKILCRYLTKEIPTLNKNNIRLRYIGRHDQFLREVQARMHWASHETAGNTGMVLTLALNYSGRTELVDALQSIVRAAEDKHRGGDLVIDDELIGKHLYTSDLPDPDLVIRTGGEMRLSNFLLWQLAYAEIYVTSALWPDFRGRDLLEAIAEYQTRERRFGGLTCSRNSN